MFRSIRIRGFYITNIDLPGYHSGQQEDISLPDQSLQLALYRNAETEDGRFHVDLNQAVVYREGEPYAPASLTRNRGENREKLRICNMEDFFWWKFSNQILGVSHEGNYLFFYPDGGNDFENAVIRVMNWDVDRGEAVIYLCCTFSTEPYEYEALAAVSMETASAGDDGAVVPPAVTAGSNDESAVVNAFASSIFFFAPAAHLVSGMLSFPEVSSQTFPPWFYHPGQVTGNPVNSFRRRGMVQF